MKLTWDQVFAWRLRRQLIEPPAGASVVDVVRRLCGVQAQVASNAELAVADRRAAAERGGVAQALADRALMKTWAMRGTLHLLAPEEAGAYLTLMAAGRSWEKPSWQRAFGVSATDLEALIEAVAHALDGRVLSREELVEEVVARSGSRRLEQQLRSGWISPVVVAGGRVAGVWQIEGTTLEIELFEEAGKIPRNHLKREASRIAAFLERDLEVAVRAI